MTSSSQLHEADQHSKVGTIAGIDCGTNSIRLLVADRQGHEIFRTSRIIRLGEGVDAQGKLSAGALERLTLALQEFIEKMQENHVSTISMIATSAVRDAHNREDFFQICSSLLSTVDPQAQVKLLSGEEESRLTFLGATHVGSGLSSIVFPALVTDLGGGSTELAVGGKQEILGSYSMDMGCVRITEKFLFSDPPTEEEITTASKYIDELIETATRAIGLELNQNMQSWIGVAGTFTTLGALTLGLERYDSQCIHGAQLQLYQLDSHAMKILYMSHKERAKIGVISPGRIDIIGAGALIVHRLISWMLNHSSIENITLSERDILDGTIYALLE